MKTPNLQAIRSELPYGSLKRIADATGLAHRVVSEFFSYGWHKQHSAAILAAAMAEIKDKYPDEELLEEFEELGLSGGYSRVPARRKKKAETEQGGNLLLWAAVAGAGLLLWKNWSKIEEMFGNGRPELTLEERLEELKNQPKGAKRSSTGG